MAGMLCSHPFIRTTERKKTGNLKDSNDDGAIRAEEVVFLL